MEKIKMTDIGHCPACDKDVDWTETEIGCEDCGTHMAILCPKCGIIFDTVYIDNGQKWRSDDGWIYPEGKLGDF
jgi:predicted amidophosphoribosyltransferase